LLGQDPHFFISFLERLASIFFLASSEMRLHPHVPQHSEMRIVLYAHQMINKRATMLAMMI